jgi:hypothetical protein
MTYRDRKNIFTGEFRESTTVVLNHTHQLTLQPRNKYPCYVLYVSISSFLTNPSNLNFTASTLNSKLAVRSLCVYHGVNISTTQSALRIIPSFSSADYSYSVQRNKPLLPYIVTSMPNPGYVDALAPVIPRHDHHKLYSHSKIIKTSTFGPLFTAWIDNDIRLGIFLSNPVSRR